LLAILKPVRAWQGTLLPRLSFENLPPAPRPPAAVVRLVLECYLRRRAYADAGSLYRRSVKSDLRETEGRHKGQTCTYHSKNQHLRY
jgi:hypothetical protein